MSLCGRALPLHPRWIARRHGRTNKNPSPALADEGFFLWPIISSDAGQRGISESKTDPGGLILAEDPLGAYAFGIFGDVFSLARYLGVADENRAAVSSREEQGFLRRVIHHDQSFRSDKRRNGDQLLEVVQRAGVGRCQVHVVGIEIQQVDMRESIRGILREAVQKRHAVARVDIDRGTDQGLA